MTRIFVHRFNVCTTRTMVYQAWELSELMGRHSTITFEDGQCLGRIGTDPDKSRYDGMPVGDERFAAVREAYEARFQVAYDAIVEAYPEAANGERSDGEITVVVPRVSDIERNEWRKVAR